jgi:type III restriction enzyme
MELKTYQRQVIQDLELYLQYLQKHQKTDLAFNKFWEDKIGVFNKFEGLGMEPYKNNIPNAPHLCVKVPTAGGKTFIACNALKTIFDSYDANLPKAVIWLVPWSNLLDQTVKNLSDSNHPYRQKLNSLFGNRVEIYQKKDLLYGQNFSPVSVKEQLSIIVLSFASLRAKNKDDRKVYQQNGQLAAFANSYKNNSHLLEDVDETALINVIRSLEPVLVVDESHNAESDLSVEMLNALNPSFVLDLTATPKNNSNLISLVPAIELKKEHMVKLPVVVYNHHSRQEVIESAIHLQKSLENAARLQEEKGEKYIRPIVLFQAQPKNANDATTFEKLKAALIEAGIAQNQIKIKTANKDELKGIELLSRDCEVRFIITINALKEGWDCPFAYVLASLADKSSAVDVTQILGRVLRQPYVKKHGEPLLNVSFVLSASAKFQETLANVVKALQNCGFSEKDYRYKDFQTDAQNADFDKNETQNLMENFLFSSLEENEDFDAKQIAPDSNLAAQERLLKIQDLALKNSQEMESQIEQENQKNPQENAIQELGKIVKKYKMVESHQELALKLVLPKFFLEVPVDLSSDKKVELSSEPLLQNFKLSGENSKIDFEQIVSDLYKIDIEQTSKDQYAPRFSKFENQNFKSSIAEFILAKPRESQIKDIAHRMVEAIGDMYPIADQEIRKFIEQVLSHLNGDQLKEILARQTSACKKIKEKIQDHVNRHAKREFENLLKIGKITCEPSWKFSKEIIQSGELGAEISKSLYEREAKMNGFETKIITEISGLPNIAFWHRNLGKSRGFSINGFKSNHYPDFILASKKGVIILVETKGDDRDNSDSAAKCALGSQWANSLERQKFSYFMIFEQEKEIEGTYSLQEAKKLISEL